MSCALTAPTLTPCNDVIGGVSKVEVSAWADDFDYSAASWTEWVLASEMADYNNTPATDATKQTTVFTHFFSCSVNSLSAFPTFKDAVKARLVAKITTVKGDTIVLGNENGLSFAGGREFADRTLEGGQGYELSYSGKSSTGTEIPS